MLNRTRGESSQDLFMHADKEARVRGRSAHDKVQQRLARSSIPALRHFAPYLLLRYLINFFIVHLHRSTLCLLVGTSLDTALESAVTALQPYVNTAKLHID